MIEDTNIQIDEPNRWRLDTPGHSGWKRTARPDDPNRYLMISADCHANEPGALLGMGAFELPEKIVELFFGRPSLQKFQDLRQHRVGDSHPAALRSGRMAAPGSPSQ